MNICMAYVVRRSMVAISENQVLRRYVRRHVIIVWRTHDTIPSEHGRRGMRRRIVQTGVASNNEREVNVDGGEFQRGETAGRPAGER